MTELNYNPSRLLKVKFFIDYLFQPYFKFIWELLVIL